MDCSNKSKDACRTSSTDFLFPQLLHQVFHYYIFHKFLWDACRKFSRDLVRYSLINHLKKLCRDSFRNSFRNPVRNFLRITFRKLSIDSFKNPSKHFSRKFFEGFFRNSSTDFCRDSLRNFV